MISTERDLPEAKLLPCPFCGWAITADEGLCKWDKDEFGDTVDEVSYTGVCCPGCSAFVPINAHTPAEAIAAWNKRTDADALASIRAERDAAVAALKPFADYIDDCGDELPDEMPLTAGSPFARKQVTVADFRRAARAIAGEQKNDA